MLTAFGVSPSDRDIFFANISPMTMGDCKVTMRKFRQRGHDIFQISLKSGEKVQVMDQFAQPATLASKFIEFAGMGLAKNDFERLKKSY